MRPSRLMIGLIAIVAFGALAPAQPVFFDDFDEDELLPHWNTPPDDQWEYNVSGGMLHVTDLLWPSDPHFGDANYALMGAGYEPQTDFRADVWMGWDAGEGPHELILHMNSPLGGIASFGYSTLLGPDPLIFAASGANDYRTGIAPPPGMYHFTITRSNGQFGFLFNEELFASFPDRFGSPAYGLTLWFLGPYPGELGTLHIDRIQVIPTPGVHSLVLGIGVHAVRHRRRRAPGCRRRAKGSKCHFIEGGSR